MASITSDTGAMETKKKSRKRLRWIIDIALILAVFWGVQWWMQRGMAAGEAPDFQHVTLSGKQVSLESYKGEPFILHFWASWCPYCNFEQGSITELAESVPVLTVAYQSGNKVEVEAFARQKGIESWDIIVDENTQFATGYGVKAVPATFIIDSEGKIRSKTAGFTTKWGLQLRLWLAKLEERFMASGKEPAK